jgi:hypothetical protein
MKPVALISNITEETRSPESNSCLASHKNSRTLPKLPLYLGEPSNIVTHPCPGLSHDFFPSGFPAKTLYAFVFSPMRATIPANLILNLITEYLVRNTNHGAPNHAACSFWKLILMLKEETTVC